MSAPERVPPAAPDLRCQATNHLAPKLRSVSPQIGDPSASRAGASGIEGNQGLPGLLHGRRVEDLAFAEGRGPDPATKDNAADFASTAVLEDPLQQ
jgi:hypothetical protein